MLAVTGSKGINSFSYLTFVFFFLYNFFFEYLFWFGSGSVLAVSLQSRLCLLHENDNRLLFETATTSKYERENCIAVI